MYWLQQEIGRVDLHLTALEVCQVHTIAAVRLKLYCQREQESPCFSWVKWFEKFYLVIPKHLKLLWHILFSAVVVLMTGHKNFRSLVFTYFWILLKLFLRSQIKNLFQKSYFTTSPKKKKVFLYFSSVKAIRIFHLVSTVSSSKKELEKRKQSKKDMNYKNIFILKACGD